VRKHATEGDCAENSQVKELIMDGSLESCQAAPKKQFRREESFRSMNRVRLRACSVFLRPY